MKKFDVTYKNEQVGSVELSRDGLFTLLHCKCTYFSQIMRLYGFSEADCFAIGILSPMDDSLSLIKKYTKNDLQKISVETCIRFELLGLDETPEKPSEKIEEPEVIEIEEPELNEPIPEMETAQEIKDEVEESLWKVVDDPASLFADPELMDTASVIRGGMIAHDGDTVLFAIPISSESPFPLMPVFRYGSSAMIEGKCCIVFRIKDGYLI